MWLLGFVAVWRGFGGGSVLGRGGNWGGLFGDIVAGGYGMRV